MSSDEKAIRQKIASPQRETATVWTGCQLAPGGFRQPDEYLQTAGGLTSQLHPYRARCRLSERGLQVLVKPQVIILNRDSTSVTHEVQLLVKTQVIILRRHSTHMTHGVQLLQELVKPQAAKDSCTSTAGQHAAQVWGCRC